MSNDGYPKTYLPLAKSTSVRHPRQFDPALKNFPCGYRHGEPQFDNPQVERQWTSFRRRLLDHLAFVVGNSEWSKQLVVRGSYVLSKWYPTLARQPGDIDWVTLPMSMDQVDLMLQSIVSLLRDSIVPHGIVLHCDMAVTDEIWMYERFPGKRLVIPWSGDFMPRSVSPQFLIQMDFVLGEPIVFPLERLDIEAEAGRASLRAASKVQSLEWKIQWLAGDTYPQAKDLYDAWCLSGDVELPYQAFLRALESNPYALNQSNWHEFCGPIKSSNIIEQEGWSPEEIEKMMYDLYQALGPTFQDVRQWQQSRGAT